MRFLVFIKLQSSRSQRSSTHHELSELVNVQSDKLYIPYYIYDSEYDCLVQSQDIALLLATTSLNLWLQQIALRVFRLLYQTHELLHSCGAQHTIGACKERSGDEVRRYQDVKSLHEVRAFNFSLSYGHSPSFHISAQDVTSVQRLLESDESNYIPAESSPDEHDPAFTQPFIPVTRKRTSSKLRLVKDLFVYALAFVGLFMIAQQIVRKAQHIHHVQHVHHTHHEHSEQLQHPELKETHANEPKNGQCDCGNSTAEAISLGCKYDSLAAAWLPEHCRDDDLTAEFETVGPGPNGSWIYWADSNHTEVVSVEEIAAMADNSSARFHMSYDWHVYHCIFYWRKQYRSRFNGITVEPRDDSEEHILHCGKVITNKVWGTVAGVALNTDT